MVRLQVGPILGDDGPGRFGLSPQQQLPYNAFVDRGTLERALEQPGRANALFVTGGTLESNAEAWRAAFSAADAMLAVRPLPGGGGLLVESERIVMAAGRGRIGPCGGIVERIRLDGGADVPGQFHLGQRADPPLLHRLGAADPSGIPAADNRRDGGNPAGRRDPAQRVGGRRPARPRRRNGHADLLRGRTGRQTRDLVGGVPPIGSGRHVGSRAGPRLRTHLQGHVRQGPDVQLGSSVPHESAPDPAHGRRLLGLLSGRPQGVRGPRDGQAPLGRAVSASSRRSGSGLATAPRRKPGSRPSATNSGDSSIPATSGSRYSLSRTAA